MKKKNGWVYVVLCLALTVLLLPIMSMVTTSFKTSAELYGGVSFLPRNPTWNNFVYVIENTDYKQRNCKRCCDYYFRYCGSAGRVYSDEISRKAGEAVQYFALHGTDGAGHPSADAAVHGHQENRLI